MTFIKSLFFLSILFFSFSCSAQEEKKDEIDITYQACLAKDSSTANISACAFVAYGKWNKEMDNTYKKLLKSLKKEKDRAALKQSQAAWVMYRDAEFKSYDNMFNLPGSKYCLIRQDGRINIVRARTQQLREYAEDLKKHK